MSMDTITQIVLTETFTNGAGATVSAPVTATSLIAQGIAGPVGPAGPAGGEDVSPIFPIVDAKTASNLAAGASVHLDSVIVALFKIGKVQQITLSSSVACKWEVKKRTGGVDTALDTIFTSGFTGSSPTHEWEPPHRDYASLVGNGVDSVFRVTVTSLDGRNAANAYTTFMFDEVDA